MEEFSFVTPVTGLSRPNTWKEDDDDDNLYTFLWRMPGRWFYISTVDIECELKKVYPKFQLKTVKIKVSRIT
jgi:hypothetical protein